MNENFRECTTGNAFSLVLGNSLIAALERYKYGYTWKDSRGNKTYINFEMPYWKYHVVGFKGCLKRGLITWDENKRSSQELTKAGELVIALLEEAGALEEYHKIRHPRRKDKAVNKQFREYVTGGTFTLNLRKTHIDAMERIAHKDFIIDNRALRVLDTFVNAFHGLERRGLAIYNKSDRLRCTYPYHFTKAGELAYALLVEAGLCKEVKEKKSERISA